MRILHLCAAAFCFALPMAGAAQSIRLAPHQSDAERVEALVADPDFGATAIEARADLRADTNVMPLNWGSRRTLPPSQFNSAHGVYDQSHSDRIALASGQWRLEFGSEQSDLYESNAGGAQLYLDSMSHTINPAGTYRAYVTMNRTSDRRLGLTYRTALPAPAGRAVVRIEGNLLFINRVQTGALRGDMVNNAFNGNLDLLTTLGIDNPDSLGIGLDASVTVPLTRTLRLGVWGENLLSRVWMRRMQNIRSNVSTNTVIPDSNGFLHGAPVLSGSVSEQALNTELNDREWAGLSLRDGHLNWLLMGSHDRSWNGAAGLCGRGGPKLRWWSLGWFDPFKWQAGADYCGLQLEIGISDVDGSRARNADVSLQYRIPLGQRTHPEKK